ncbi:Uu.00g073800.m01.CDS01 [Anthostomella pinea]|uniref:Uu.00g073800.m01.CDS01 n=1 Tax=Anthostomella pinea TaxID=933095 RepID=A0AAI8VVY9_9PEZI|nr:Uu.00g073800.m01.CDS01 [Anthostomella pinea]
MASSVRLYPRSGHAETPAANPLPQLIQTPSGLAILELQGTINLPQIDESGSEINTEDLTIGRITFPDYHPETHDPSSTSWMKRIHLYVGQHQRLTGEVKKLPRAVAIIRKKPHSGEDMDMADANSETTKEDLEIVEIVKHKLVFSQRPEPVGSG